MKKALVLFALSLFLFSCSKEVANTFSSEETIDLGLSVKWRGWNVGASAPEELGNRYSWGEIKTKSRYGEDNYKYGTWPDGRVTKYCTWDLWWSGAGDADYKSVLDSEDDVAQVDLGNGWRMPTVEEMRELLNYCDWKMIEYKGVLGYKATSSVAGYEKKSVFFPYEDMGILTSAGYWSSSLATDNDARDYPTRAAFLRLEQDNVSVAVILRNDGLFVRPVRE